MATEQQPYPGSLASIEGVAADFRRQAIARIQPGGPIEGGEGVRDFLDRLVHFLRGRIEISSVPSWEEIDGGSLIIEPRATSFVIRLSPHTTPLRDNFTIAHELGHFALHYPHNAPVGEAVRFNRYGSGLIEAQANRFAAAFLMPAEEFKVARRAFGDDAYVLAGHFGVSQPAVSVRMEYIQ
jgi:predicted transcriptional regulator